MKLELENTFNEDGDRETSVEPTIVYRHGNWKTHLQYEKPVHPESEDGSVEWQYDYKWKYDRSSFSIRNEVKHNLDKDQTTSELTPRWYYNKTKSVELGFDLEIDYYDSAAVSTFDLFEVEIEPTVIWTRLLDRGQYGIELEAPILRLYSNDNQQDGFKYVGLEIIFGYVRKLPHRTRLEFEFQLPYDAEKNELETSLNFAVHHRF